MVQFLNMRRLFTQKRLILVLSILSLVTLLLLASGLHDVEFQAGRALGSAESRSIQFSVDRAIRAITDVPFWKQAVF